MARPAIFLDRDGTLNYDAGYTHRIGDWRWLPGALAGLAAFSKAGYPLVVVSNQSGIARGFYDSGQLKTLEAWLDDELARAGIRIAGWYYCPHGPDDKCLCRKPRPGLVLRAAAELDLDPGRSWLLGDRLSDLQAGAAAGCKVGLVRNPAWPEETAKAAALFPHVLTGENLEELAAKVIACGPARL